MRKTPNADRLHVTIFGDTNSGKSTLFNKILGVDVAITSDQKGTTTDPVSKAMELLPYGPILLTDTAGLNDKTELGDLRLKKTLDMILRTDFAIYTIDAKNFNKEEYFKTKNLFIKYKIPYILVCTKADINEISNIKQAMEDIEETTFLTLSYNKTEYLENLKAVIIEKLYEIERENEAGLLDAIVKRGDTITLVIPIDSEAPKGRLILPQAKLIREALDKHIICNVTEVDTLSQSLKENQNVKLVITDSQAFKEVEKIVPENINLTSFSILVARQKGNIKELINGLNAIENLKDGDKVLIAEACTHTKNHEDIGTVKIPNMLNKLTNKNLQYDFSNGKEYRACLNEYALVIHCGGCMITKKEMSNRILTATSHNTPIINYGIILAYGAGILKRSIKIFEGEVYGR